MFYQLLTTRAWIENKQFSKAKGTPDKAKMEEMTEKASVRAEGKRVEAKKAMAKAEMVEMAKNAKVVAH